MRKIFIIVFLFVVLFTTSCRTVYVHGRMPILERPDRPTLVNIPGTEMQKMSAAARNDVAGNFNKLIDHVRKLEIAIDEYNIFAEAKNAVTYNGDD